MSRDSADIIAVVGRRFAAHRTIFYRRIATGAADDAAEEVSFGIDRGRGVDRAVRYLRPARVAGHAADLCQRANRAFQRAACDLGVERVADDTADVADGISVELRFGRSDERSFKRAAADHALFRHAGHTACMESGSRVFALFEMDVLHGRSVQITEQTAGAGFAVCQREIADRVASAVVNAPERRLFAESDRLDRDLSHVDVGNLEVMFVGEFGVFAAVAVAKSDQSLQVFCRRHLIGGFGGSFAVPAVDGFSGCGRKVYARIVAGVTFHFALERLRVHGFFGGYGEGPVVGARSEYHVNVFGALLRRRDGVRNGELGFCRAGGESCHDQRRLVTQPGQIQFKCTGHRRILVGESDRLHLLVSVLSVCEDLCAQNSSQHVHLQGGYLREGLGVESLRIGDHWQVRDVECAGFGLRLYGSDRQRHVFRIVGRIVFRVGKIGMELVAGFGAVDVECDRACAIVRCDGGFGIERRCRRYGVDSDPVAAFPRVSVVRRRSESRRQVGFDDAGQVNASAFRLFDGGVVRAGTECQCQRRRTGEQPSDKTAPAFCCPDGLVSEVLSANVVSVAADRRVADSCRVVGLFDLFSFHKFVV